MSVLITDLTDYLEFKFTNGDIAKARKSETSLSAKGDFVFVEAGWNTNHHFPSAGKLKIKYDQTTGIGEFADAESLSDVLYNLITGVTTTTTTAAATTTTTTA